MRDLDKAIEVIGNRREDTKLVNNAKQFLSEDIPDIFARTQSVPVCYAPHIASGAIAEVGFACEVLETAGVPVTTSYVEDSFTTNNPAKVGYWRPRILWPKGQATRQWIVDKQYRELGRSIGNTPTLLSTPDRAVTVTEYQRGLADLAFESTQLPVGPDVVDYSQWYKRQCEYRDELRSAAYYYPAIMALYSVFGVLYRYDNQPGDADIQEFRARIAKPAMEYTSDILGAEPIVVSREFPSDGLATDLSMLSEEEAIQVRQNGPLGGVGV